MTLNIIHLYKDYFPPVVGGIEKHVNLLCTELRKNGAEVQVIVSSRSLQRQEESINGIHVIKVPELGRIASTPINPTLSSQIRKAGSKADIFHFHFPNPSAEISFLVSFLKKNVVVTYHSDIIRQKILLRIYTPLMYKFLRKTKVIIATSPNYLQTSPVLKAFRNKCKCIPLGIDFSSFKLKNSQFEEVKALHDSIGSFLVLFIGKFRYYKGLFVLLEAVKNIDVKLLLIGSGPLEHKLKRWVDEHGINSKVRFLGELPDAHVKLYLNACDVLVLPSILRSEAFGMVLLEAMACGKPVISTELGTGTSFVNLNDITGIVVPPNDARKLADAIMLLKENPDLKEHYGRNARKRVQANFSIQDTTRRLIEIYKQCLDETIFA